MNSKVTNSTLTSSSSLKLSFVGAIDSATALGTIEGWIASPRGLSGEIEVNVYLDAPAGNRKAIHVGHVKVNLSETHGRPSSGQFRLQLEIPASLQADGLAHRIYVHPSPRGSAANCGIFLAPKCVAFEPTLPKATDEEFQSFCESSPASLDCTRTMIAIG